MGSISHMELQQRQELLARQMEVTLYHHNLERLSHSNPWPILQEYKGSSLPEEVGVQLEDKKLWEQFHQHKTEMIITKTGRRMFPALNINIKGLERGTHYCVVLEMMLSSGFRYKYLSKQSDCNKMCDEKGWKIAAPADYQTSLSSKIYVHPSSPSTGSNWMTQKISFAKFKLTNNQLDPKTNIILNSMHKYVPRIWVICCDGSACVDNMRFYPRPSKCFIFKETEFIAVTAYQNEAITQMKIDHNPFAKGFRALGHASNNKRKRPPRMNEASNSDGEEFEPSSGSDSETSTKPTNQPTENENGHLQELLSNTPSESGQAEASSGHEMNPGFYRPWLGSATTEERQQSAQSLASPYVGFQPSLQYSQNIPTTYPIYCSCMPHIPPQICHSYPHLHPQSYQSFYMN